MFHNICMCLMCALVLGCFQKKGSLNIQPEPLHSPPFKVSGKTDTVFQRSIVGTEIEPILVNNQPLKTGVRQPIEGSLLPSAHIKKPTINTIIKPPKIPAVKNGSPVNQLTVNITPYVPQIPVDTNAIIRVENILIQERKIPCIYPKSNIANPPHHDKQALYDIQCLDVEEGMSNSIVNCILEDKRGDLWFGLYTGGISRYDGSSFVHFSTREGLTNMYVTCMLEDRLGNIWIGTHGGGISRFDGSNFIRISEKNGLPSNYVNCMSEDHHGNIWIGTRDNGLCYYIPQHGKDSTQLVKIKSIGSLNVRSIEALVTDDIGNVWIGTADEGLIHLQLRENLQNPAIRILNTENGLPQNSISALFKDSRSNIWIGTNEKGICKIEGSLLSYYTQLNGLNNDKIRAFGEDQAGNILIGTAGGGVNIYSGNTVKYITENEGLTNNIIRAVMTDSGGNIWIGTAGGGVCRFDPNSFIHINEDNGLTQFRTTSFIQDKDGNMWFGTLGGGAIKWYIAPDGSVSYHQQFTKAHGLPSDYILCIEQDHAGHLWFGTSGSGAFKIDDDSITIFKKENGLSDNDIRDILCDSKNNIWFATLEGGITYYNNAGNNSNVFIHYTTHNGLPLDFSRKIFEDSKQNIWIGTAGRGVVKFERTVDEHRGFITILSPREGLPSLFVNAMLEDNYGNIWMGTGNGLLKYKLNQSNIEHVFFGERRGGLSNNLVRSLAKDKNGNIWIGTARGLNVIAYPETDTAKLFSFNAMSGLHGKEFEFNSAFIDQTNTGWWGTEKGVERLDLNNYLHPSFQPLPRIRNLLVNSNHIQFRNPPDEIRQQISYSDIASFENYPSSVKLPYNYNHLTFHFSATDWNSPYQINYTYLMEGLNETWSVPSPLPNADFNGLTHGRYTLKISAAGKSQTWSQPVAFSFVIMPPWWQAWWAYTIYWLIALIIIYLIYRFQLNRKLEIADHKRLIELDALKNKLFTNITHEFRTPLTLIHGPISNALTNNVSLDEKEMASMYQQSRRLQQLITQMLDLQKIEAGKMQINYVFGDVVAFARYLFESFEQTASEKELVLEFASRAPEILMDYDEEKFTQIIINLLANAIRHTSAGGKVSLHLDRHYHPDTLVIEVRDNGVGIAKDELPFIFDRFYQSSRAAQGGTGIGLSLAKNLVELLKGKITVESQPEQETVFRLTLPISDKGPKANQQLKTGDKLLIPSLDDEARFADPAGIDPDNPMILIVEDHPQVLKFISACLARDFTVITAKDGEEGIQKAFEFIPDLIISDIMMPGKNGFELCAAIKANILTSHIPVILLTGRGDQAALMEGIAHGADAYVVKPFEPAELNLRITKLLELRDSLSEHYKKIASSENGTDAPEISVVENEFILKIRSFIEEHINDSQFNMHSLTRHMGMSHPQLHRKMIALTGESTGKFVRSVRMSKAIDLLKNSDLNVSEIAYEVGFSEPGYFTKVFTKEYNITPTEFRTNQLKV